MSRCGQCGLEREDGECPRCGVASIEIPPLIDGRFSILGRLGEGAMGAVYRARDLAFGREVALKVLRLDVAATPDLVDRFRREATLLASVRSDHVVAVHAMGTAHGLDYFVMDLVRGRNLDEILAEHAQHRAFIPLYRALTLVRQTALGLAAVHRAGLVHRDVKPANIVIEEDSGRPILLDFGLARKWDPNVAAATIGAGTPAYMAPEQIGPAVAAELISPRADIYALACVAFELLTGRPPFTDDDPYVLAYRHANEPPPRVSSLRGELSAVDPVIARALSKNPAERFATAIDFADALSAVIGRPRLELVDEEERTSSRSISGRHDPATPIRVLIADDDDEFRGYAARAVRMALHGRNVSLDRAANGQEAVEMVRAAPPQLIILDFNMPVLDGIEALSRIRELPGGPEARVLVTSAAAGDFERWRFSVLGVQDFVRKPIDLIFLVKSIAEISKRFGWLRKRRRTAEIA